MSERVNAVTEGSMVQNERGGRTADCAMPIRHTMLTVLRNLGWAALVSQGVPLLLRSIRLLDSGSVITLYMLLLFVASGLAVVLGLTRPIVGIENSDGNTNVRFHQKDTLKRFFERFEQNKLIINRPLENIIVLGNHAEEVPPGRQAAAFGFQVTQQDFSLIASFQAGQKVDQGRLASPRWAD